MISIIIPTLNEEKYLPLLFDSIKQQDFHDYEIIVADAGSADKTLEIAKSYGATVVTGGLPAVGRNSGARVARGDMLLFLDADVILPPHFLTTTLEEFKKRKLGFAGFPLLLTTENSVDRFFRWLFNASVRISSFMVPRTYVAIMALRLVHERIGGFDESVVFLEDFCYALAAGKVSRYGYINIPFFTAARRYEKDGRFVYLKYFMAEWYTLLIGPIRSDIFKYKFNHYKDEK